MKKLLHFLSILTIAHYISVIKCAPKPSANKSNAIGRTAGALLSSEIIPVKPAFESADKSISISKIQLIPASDKNTKFALKIVCKNDRDVVVAQGMMQASDTSCALTKKVLKPQATTSKKGKSTPTTPQEIPVATINSISVMGKTTGSDIKILLDSKTKIDASQIKITLNPVATSA